MPAPHPDVPVTTSQPFAAVVFDFDGTLAELTLDFNDMRRKLAALAASYLDEVPEPDGLPCLEWSERLTEAVAEVEGHEMAMEFATRCRFLILTDELNAARKGKLFPFAEPLLAELKARGRKVGIITRNSLSAVRIVFPHAQQHVSCLLAREDAPRVKPDPAHLAAALACLGADAAATLVVGDHPLDIATARALGAHAGAVATGRLSLDELAAHSPDFLAPDARALMDQLMGQGLV